MNSFPGKIFKLIFFILPVTVNNLCLYAQDGTSVQQEQPVRSMYLPHFETNSRYISSIGLSMVQPPKDMVEVAIQAPLFNYRMVYALPKHFSLSGSFSSIIVSNQISAGPAYDLTFNNSGLKLGWDIAYVFGRMKHLGFDNTTRAWLSYPNVSGSYQWNKMVFTLKAEAVLVSSVRTKTGENEVYNANNFYNGFTGAFYLEQRLHKNKVIIVGFKDSYVKYYWPVWLAFSTFNRFYHVPEISVCWII
jgi:hypothetical protein